MITRHWLYCYVSFVADLAESRIYHYVILNATLWKDFYIQLYSWLWSHFIVSIECAVVVVVVWYTCSWIYNYLCKISVYHHLSCEFESRSWRGILDTTLYDKVCKWLATGWWLYPGTPVSSTEKTDRVNINKILLKVALNTMTLVVRFKIAQRYQRILKMIYFFFLNWYVVKLKICAWI
jgi:hypothetical protein